MVVAIVLVSLLLSAVAVRAGFWQLGRHEARAAAIALSDQNASRPAVTVAEAAADGSLLDDEWATVTATGRFTSGEVTLLRNRPVDRERVYQLLAWFTTDDGRSLLVNVGHIPVPAPDVALVLPPLPEGDATVSVVVRAFEPDDGRRDTGATRIVLTQVPEPAGQPYDAYGVLREACTDAGCATSVGAPVPLPELSLGPHLAYTWQWFAFAVIAPVGGVLLARREWRLSGDDVPEAAAPKAPRAPRPRRSGPSDEEIEDAL